MSINDGYGVSGKMATSDEYGVSGKMATSDEYGVSGKMAMNDEYGVSGKMAMKNDGCKNCENFLGQKTVGEIADKMSVYHCFSKSDKIYVCFTEIDFLGDKKYAPCVVKNSTLNCVDYVKKVKNEPEQN